MWISNHVAKSKYGGTNGLLLSCRSSHLLYGNSVGIIKAVQRLTSPDEKSHEITEVNSSIKNFRVFPLGLLFLVDSSSFRMEDQGVNKFQTAAIRLLLWWRLFFNLKFLS